AKQHDARTRLGLPAGPEDLVPAIVDLAEDTGDHAAHLVGRCALLCGSRAIGLIAWRVTTAARENFRATDENARIDSERVAHESEHDDGADAESAAAHRQTEAATAHSTAFIVATVLDILAATEVIVAHGGISSLKIGGDAFARTQRCSHLKFPLH